jgi:hypothetical protein
MILHLLILINSATPCDPKGNDLPRGAPPPPPEPKDPNDWSPFETSIQFRLADLMYRRGQLLKRIIDDLLDLWALDNLGKEPPFADHQDLYNVLDAIQIGDTPWQTFDVGYEGERPMENVPSWMDQKFEV